MKCVVPFIILFVAALARKPVNFVIFNPDEMRAESLGCYGNKVAKTPNFDMFAAQGTRFDQCHTTATVCTQSRASFMTGWYTHVRGHRSLWHLLHNDEPNLLRYLKEAGYTVKWWGKNDLLAADSFNTSVTSAMHMGGPQNGGNFFPFGEAGYYSFLSEAYNGNWNETADYNNVAAAVQFLNSKPTEPFMVYLPLIKPHPPYSAPEPFYSAIDSEDVPDVRSWGLDKKPDYHQLIRKHRNLTSLNMNFFKKLQAVYMGSISYSDHLFGILLKALQDNGYADSTAVFVFADHGDYAGDYGLVEKWPSGLEDVLTRVPLLVRMPGGAVNHVVEEQVQHMDIVATILSIANITAQHTHFSEDLTPLLMGGRGDPNRVVYSQGGYGTNEPLDFEGQCNDHNQSGVCDPRNIYYPKGRQQQLEPLSVCRSVMIRTPTHKLVLRTDPKDVDHCSELYDLKTDPRELKNVYNDSAYVEIQQQLKHQLLVWYMQTSDVTPYHEDSRGYFPPRYRRLDEVKHAMSLDPQLIWDSHHVEDLDSVALLHEYYQQTPIGYVLKECVHDVPNGASVVVTSESFQVTNLKGQTKKIAKCGSQRTKLPTVLRQASAGIFPSDYNGWLAYTAFNSSKGFSAFLGNFSVPDKPEEPPDVLYLFTGLQNKDWVPLVDPEKDGAGFDIIQPVLQYPCDGDEWCVRSWYVTLDGGVMVSDPLTAKPGDTIYGNMTKIGDDEWFVGSTVSSSRRTTSIRVSHERLSKQLWAYTTLEGYGVRGCTYYPDNTCVFTDLKLYSSDGHVEKPLWRVNPKPNPKPQCHEMIKVNSPSSITISFD